MILITTPKSIMVDFTSSEIYRKRPDQNANVKPNSNKPLPPHECFNYSNETYNTNVEHFSFIYKHRTQKVGLFR